MDRSGPRARVPRVVLLATAVIAVGLATMGGIVARAVPAAAARQSYGVVRNHVDLIDPSRSTPPRGSHGTLPYRYLPTDLYLPDGPGPFPLVVFAAGFNIRTDAYTSMLQQWAAAGYLVAAPQFPISGQPSDGAARRDDQANEPADVSFVISSLTAAVSDPFSPVHDRIDRGRIGVAGHSDGGTDAAAIAINSRSVDRRVSSVLVLAPDVPSFPGSWNGAINDAAVLVMGGTADPIAAPADADAVYATAAAPKVQIRLEGAGHLEPFVTDARSTGAAWAAQIAFLDATLRDDPTGRARLQDAGTTAGVATMRQDGLQPNPFGSLDAATVDVLGTVTVTGWSIDPDTSAPTAVHVWVDGTFAGEHVADEARPDVAAAFPDLGVDHGYRVSLVHQATGTHEVCVYGINVGGGDANVRLGCQTVAVATNPFGSLDRVTVDPLLRATVQGWAIDPDTTGPVALHVYVDGAKVGTATADASRADVGAAFPGFGANHGFLVPLPGLAHGGHEVCVYAMNAGGGTANTRLAPCARVDVDHDPFGSLDEATVGIGGAVRVGGWALDPDTTGAIGVHVYVDGARRAELSTTIERGDVAAAFPGGGSLHGFAVTVPALGEGTHTVCAYGINAGAGAANSLLGRCRVVSVAHRPFGSLDVTTVGPDRTATVSGWAIDPDTTDPIGVHVYVDGVKTGAGTANLARGDVGAAFPLFGAAHGYSVAAGKVTAGTHEWCAYGINVGTGTNELLGCRRVLVP